MTTTLLPCPFCGKQPEVEKPSGDSDVFWNIYCPCLSPQVMEATEQEAVEKWNRRTPPPDASGDTPPSDAGKAGDCRCQKCGHIHMWKHRVIHSFTTACPKCGDVMYEQVPAPTPSTEGKGGKS